MMFSMEKINRKFNDINDGVSSFTLLIAFLFYFPLLVPFPWMMEIIILCYSVLILTHIGWTKKTFLVFFKNVLIVAGLSVFHYEGIYWKHVRHYFHDDVTVYVDWLFMYDNVLPMTEDSIMRNFMMVPYFFISGIFLSHFLATIVANYILAGISVIMNPFKTAFVWKTMDASGVINLVVLDKFVSSYINGWKKVYKDVWETPLREIENSLDYERKTIMEVSGKNLTDFSLMSDDEFSEFVGKIINTTPIHEEDKNTLKLLLEENRKIDLLTLPIRIVGNG